MSASEELAIVIMAGGQSRRMGREKAALTFQGESLLHRIALTALECSPRVWVVGCEQPQSWILANVRFAVDDEPALGPIGGLATALRVADSAVIAVACDMPRLDETAIRWLVSRYAESNAAHGVVACRNEQLEPLFACYEPSVGALVAQQLKERVVALRHLIAAGDFEEVEVPDEYAHWLLNVNRPEDLALLLP